jgi:sterol 24-C-methyltransferase
LKTQRDQEQNIEQKSIEDQINGYTNLHNKDESERNSNYQWFVNAYYNVSTVFYEWAWGTSFHFAPQKPYESFQAAILRHECRLADRLRLAKGLKVLDVGCGIGGPLINISKNTGAHITGLNNNAYQVSRANALLKENGLDKCCNMVKGDFCNMEFATSGSYDACYAIESTCHAPKREDVFREVYRVLKPGGLFGGYEWVLTDKHDPDNESHVEAAKNVEIGNGLPSTSSYTVVRDALKASGFEILETEDFFSNISGDDLPWWRDLEASYWRLSTFQFWPIGKFIYKYMLIFLEKFRIAPLGTTKVAHMLQLGGVGLVAGGKMGTFTPGYFFLARKPISL